MEAEELRRFLNYISKTTRIVPNPAAERKAESARICVNSGWLPLNPLLLQEIQQKLESGVYVENRTQLFDDLRGDLSLFTHAIRFMRNRLTEPEPTVNPAAGLAELDDEDLRKMLLTPALRHSKHKLSGINKLRSDIIKSSYASGNAAHAIAVEGVSAGVDIEPNSAYSCALLRQLGWNLIAWNYSPVLGSVLRNSKSEEEAARATKALIGISPIELSAEYAREWLLTPELRDAIQPNYSSYFGSATARVHAIRSVCEVSEAFGRTQAPSRFPGAEKQWERKSKQLESLVPEIDLQAFKSAVEEQTGRQLESLHQAAIKRRPATVQIFAAEKAVAHSKRSFESNTFLRKCPEAMREQFRPVYDEMKDNAPSAAALQSLVSKAIPAAGFAGGVIYLLDGRNSDLVPAIKIGAAINNISKHLNSLLAASAEEAFNSEVPMRKEEIVDNQLHVEHISASFGRAEKPGVLLLELSAEAAQTPEHDGTLYFKAIRQCLHDCLAI